MDESERHWRRVAWSKCIPFTRNCSAFAVVLVLLFRTKLKFRRKGAQPNCTAFQIKCIEVNERKKKSE